MARKLSYESSGGLGGGGLGGVVPLAIIGGIIGGVGYYLYKNWDYISTLNPFSLESPPIPISTEQAVSVASAAANAAQIQFNNAFVEALQSNDAARAEEIRLEALRQQVIIGLPRDPRTPINCLQPNIIVDNECVNPFTLESTGLLGLGTFLKGL